METHYSAIAATGATVATSIAEIEKISISAMVATGATVYFINGNHIKF